MVEQPGRERNDVAENRNLSVMFTDIKGFTSRTAKSTREELAGLLRTHEEIVLPRAQERGGTLIKAIGDAYLFTFESPTNAVLAGIEIQSALRAHNHLVDAKNRIELRMGINVGEVTVIEGDVFGDAVNIASRIESIAEPGDVTFSESVYLTMNKTELDRALDTNELRTSEVGYRRLKGVDHEIRIYRIHRHVQPTGIKTLELKPADTGPLDLVREGELSPRAIHLNDLELNTVELKIDLMTGAPALAGKTKSAAKPSNHLRTAPHRVQSSGRWGHRVAVTVCTLVAIAGALVALAAWSLESWWLGGLGLGVALAAQPFSLGFAHSRALALRGVGALGAAVVLIAGQSGIFDEVQRRNDRLAELIADTGAGALTGRDLVGAGLICGLRVADLWARGWHQASRAHWLVLTGQGKPQRWMSDALMGSPGVVAALASFSKRLEVEWHQGKPQARLDAVPVSFTSNLEPAGLVATVDKASLGATAKRDAKGWQIDVEGHATVQFRRGAPVPLRRWGGRTMQFDPALGWALQQRGWIQPYTAIWAWTIRADDPRIELVANPKRK